MKTLLLNLWAWIVAHPAETMGGLYVALNIINKMIPVESRKTSKLAAVLDRLCVLTQRGAVGATSWPVVGRSIAKEIAAPERETQAPPPPRESEPGYAESRVLAAIAAVSLVALALLTGCASSPPSLRPIAPHLVERAEYGQCAETGGKIEVPQAGVVALLTSVCWMRADSGVAVDAAPEPVVVVPDKADAGVSE